MAKLSCVMFALAATGGSAANTISRMKIDADGMVDKFTANTDADTAADTAQMVLAEMEDWARSGARPEEPKIKTIEDLAQQLDKALVDTHAAAQKQVQKNIGEIEKCNSDQASAIKTISETTKVEVGKQRTTHATCRDGEVVIFKDMQAKCKHLTTWLKETSEGSPEKPAGAGDDEMVEYVEKMSGYWCKKGEAAEEKQKVCEKRKEDHSAEKEKCDALQAQFENSFCSWRTKLIDVCEEQKTCYDAAKKAYDDHVSDTKKLVIKWKTEYTALKKILCYVKVWLSDDNAETVDAGELKRCQELSPNDSKMDINFGKAPEKSQCSLEDVAKYPGTDAFKETEYSKWAEFVNEPTACLEDEKESAAETALDMDKIVLGSAGQSCKEACSKHGGCNPKLEELIFATGDAVKTLQAIAKSQGRTCSADHQNGHWLSPYINKGSSTQCNVGDGTKAKDPCNGGHPNDQRFCLCNEK